METITNLSWIGLVFALGACAGGVPTPDAPVHEKRNKCQQVSDDGELGCKACVGVDYCGWTQTTSIHEGNCEYRKDPGPPPMINSALECPSPKIDLDAESEP